MSYANAAFGSATNSDAALPFSVALGWLVIPYSEERELQYVLVSTKPSDLGTVADSRALEASEARRALSGFFLFGLLMSSLGALLPVWGFHLESNFITAGNYFLSLSAGLLLAVRVGPLVLRERGIVFAMVVSSALACGAFLLLAFISLSAWPAWRALGLLCIGFSAGLLNQAVFHAISPLYEHDRAATITFAGTLYGLGCMLTALLIAGTYTVYTTTSVLILLAAIPGFYIGIYARAKFSREPVLRQVPLRDVVNDFKNPGAVLFSLLLFFQFGNEWSVAGWLPLFLIRRLGISPQGALFMLALYWGALLVGRVVAQLLLKRVSHGLMLAVSIVMALFGCILLSYTTNRFGATTAILFIGCGFASIYPLVVEKIGHRFTYYHPGFYNGIFSFAFTGGLLAPCLIGYLAQLWEIRIAMVIPLLGTMLVLLLFLLILLESKLSGEPIVKRARA
jgi:FHS family glucose/mannose:H+ symporter-like MFS transporter